MLQNDHINRYLEHYIHINSSPEFAVLLRGKWGSGKTWFIKQFIADHPEMKYFYVSLYGMSSFSDIENSFFQQLHPLLASKGMKLAGKIMKGLVKATIKLDLNDDKESDIELNSSVPGINLPDYLKDLDDRVLIFDDLERSSMPMAGLLGYINQFVEHNGLKVIIIGNEDQILSDQATKKLTDSEKYVSIKEKLIGKSFDIITNNADAYNTFVLLVDDQRTLAILTAHRELVLEIFTTAGYDNLRHLRQTILDFARFYPSTPSLVDEHSDIAIYLLQYFFVITFELKRGTLVEDEIYRITTYTSITTKEDSKDVFQTIRKKYNNLLPYKGVPVTLFVQFFKYGIVNSEFIESELKSSPFFHEAQTPNWIKLWSFYDHSDTEFEKILKAVSKEFYSYKVKDKYEVLQIAGILMTLFDRGLFSENKESIYKAAKRNFDSLIKNNEITVSMEEEFPSDNSNSLYYQGREFKEFKKLIAYANKVKQLQQARNLQDNSNEVLSCFNDQNFHLFYDFLVLRNSGNSKYFDTPVLAGISVDAFKTHFIKLSNKNKRRLSQIFNARYSRSDTNLQLHAELKWIKSLKTVLRKEAITGKGKISGNLITDVVMPCLDSAIEKLTISKKDK